MLIWQLQLVPSVSGRWRIWRYGGLTKGPEHPLQVLGPISRKYWGTANWHMSAAAFVPQWQSLVTATESYHLQSLEYLLSSPSVKICRLLFYHIQRTEDTAQERHRCAKYMSTSRHTLEELSGFSTEVFHCKNYFKTEVQVIFSYTTKLAIYQQLQ